MTVMKEAFAFTEEDVSGLIWSALATSHGNDFRTFKSCLFEEVYNTLQVMDGAPSAEATAYRTECIDTFLETHGPLAKVLIEMLPRGDWRRYDRVELYPEPGSDLSGVSRRTLAHGFACSILKMFTPRVFRIYARHHWTGYEVVQDQVGALQACHGLYRRTVLRFLEKFGKRNAAPSLPDGPHPVADGAGEVMLPLTDGDDVERGVDAPQPSESSDPHAVLKDEADMAKTNAKRRAKMKDYWEIDPLWRLKIQRLVDRALRGLLHGKFRVGGWEFEREQRALVAGAILRGESLSNVRDYRGLIAARNELENACLER